MPVNSEDFLRFAQEECITSKSEIGFRNSISRAYYCMFHYARTVLKNGPREVNSPHQKLIDYLLSIDAARLEDKNQSDLRKMGSMLLQRRRMRNLADYDLTKTYGEVDAKEGIEAAHLFIAHCESMCNKSGEKNYK